MRKYWFDSPRVRKALSSYWLIPAVFAVAFSIGAVFTFLIGE